MPCSDNQLEQYKKIAREIRRDLLSSCHRSGSGHVGSSLSIVEILVALYYHCLSVSPGETRKRNRDRFILSKGHGCPALYATLHRRGFISQDVIHRFARDEGALEQHPTRNLDLGIELSTGSLGQGLSVGVGMALAGKYDRLGHRVFVLLSDGETNEGTVWEAAMLASQQRLDNLIALVDYNKMQALGRTEEIVDLEPFSDKWKSFGWGVLEIDGHDIGDIIHTIEAVPLLPERPSCIIAHTVKGKGVAFMENSLLWHYRCPDKDEFEQAICELDLDENDFR